MAKSNVAQTQVVAAETTVYPYYDDFNEDKNFHRILFRPGYAVQARELTQIQTILQNQIERFGKHIFSEGSVVIGGSIDMKKSNMIRLNPQYANNDIEIGEFIGKQITNPSNRKILAEVVAADVANPETPYLAISYVGSGSNDFDTGDTIQIVGTTTNATVSFANTSVKGTIAQVQEGIFFTHGYFVKSPTQSLILTTNNTTATCKVGLEYRDIIITEDEDASLLDPALESYNYQAPGATRYSADLVLAKRDLNVEDDLSKFIELMRVESGKIMRVNRYPVYSVLGDTLARRTYDESGDYTVNPFIATLQPNKTNNNFVNIVLDAGKAYVKGYEFETTSPTTIPLSKARTTRSITNYDLNMSYGNYVTVNKIRSSGNSFFDTNSLVLSDVHCVPTSQVNSANDSTYNSTKIGSAVIRNMIFDNNGGSNDNPDAWVYRAYIYNTNFNALNSEKLTKANTLIANSLIVKSDGGTLSNSYQSFSSNGEFRFIYNTYAVPNEVLLYEGNASAQTKLIFSANANAVVQFGGTITGETPEEYEILEHIALGGSRFIGPNGSPPSLGIDDRARFGIVKFYHNGAGANTHYRVQIKGASPYEYSMSVRANNAVSSILLANNSSFAYKLSAVDDAYKNVPIRIYAGNANGYTGTITSYNGATRVATVNPAFINTLLPNANTKYSMNFDETDMESIITGGRMKESRADITNASKVGNVASGDTYIYETNFKSLVFPLPDTPVAAGSINNPQYAYKKIYKEQEFNSGQTTISAGTNESFVGVGGLSPSTILDNYLVVVKNNYGSGNVANGQIISFAQNGYSVTVSGNNSVAFNAPDLANDSTFLADIITTVNIDSGASPKQKVLKLANNSYMTSNTPDGGPFGSAKANVYLSSGQVYIRFPNKTSGVGDNLYISDVYRLKGVYESTANTIASGTKLSTLTNITNYYTLDNGQKDSIYDHAKIMLKPGFSPPRGAIIVCVDYFTTSTSGYFSVDSYNGIAYEDIPSFVEKKTDKTYQLRDCIDFRPHRTNATNTDSTYSVTGNRIPIPNENFELDYSYYLPRIDKLVLNRSLNFKLIRGIPREVPQEPKISSDDMLLYTFQIPAYTFNPKDVDVIFHENKRYTMRDIGKIEKRVDTLEYYSTLSLLEQTAMEKTVLDNNGLERTKYGILVDSFTRHDVGDVSNPHYECSLDTDEQYLRAPFKTRNIDMIPKSTNENVVTKDNIMMLKYSTTPLVTQEFASKPVAIQDFSIARYDGELKLVPETDIWYSDVRLPDNLINVSNTITLTNRWNSWLRNWLGADFNIRAPLGANNTLITMGDKLVDVSIIPYMRERQVNFLGQIIRPERRLYSFFDDVDVNNYVARANELVVSYSNGSTENDFIDLARGEGESLVAGLNSAPLLLTKGNTFFVGIDDGDREIAFGNDVPSVVTTEFVSIGSTRKAGNEAERLAIRTKEYKPTRKGAISIIYNMYKAINSFYVYRGNTSIDLGVLANNKNAYNSSLIFTNDVGIDNPDEFRFPNNKEIERYLAIPYSGSNTRPSIGVGGWGAGPSAISAYNNGANPSVLRNFGIVDIDYDPAEGNTITVVVGVATPASNTPYQFAYTHKSTAEVRSIQLVDIDPIIGGQKITGSKSNAKANVISVIHYSGYVTPQSNTALANTIKLESVASNVTDFYKGNTIYIVNGRGAGQKRNITAYNATTKVASLDTAWSIKPIGNSIYSIGNVVSTDEGEIAGTFYLPCDEDINFRTGERVFKITDSALNDDDDATTKAEHSYQSQGLLRTRQQDVVSVRTQPIRPVRRDPLAQNFTVDPEQHPSGVFIDSIDLWFAAKDNTLPVTVEIKPTVNGYPSAATGYPGAITTVKPANIKVSAIPRTSNTATMTRFQFKAPVYLKPGEHSFVVSTDSRRHELWVSEMGQPVIGTNTLITNQPYLGSMFKSQNSTTWTPFQYEDIMFRINKCSFNTSVDGIVYLQNQLTSGRYVYDGFTFTSRDIEFTGTDLKYEIAHTLETSGKESSYSDLIPNKTVMFAPSNNQYDRRIIGRAKNMVTSKITMTTDNSDVTPMIDNNRNSFIIIENVINNGGINNEDIKLIDAGSGYTDEANIVVTITGGGGSGATAVAYTDDDDTILDIVVTNPGSGYFGTPTITITGGGGSGATAVINSEEGNAGGNMLTRYITRKVSLAEGFDAGDLKVYVDAYKPAGTDIQIYYRVLNTTDATPFEERPYVQMVQVGKDVRSRNPEDYIEYEFNASDIEGKIKYNPNVSDNQYKSFKYFSIKIVMTARFESMVPKIKNLRVMALPEGGS